MKWKLLILSLSTLFIASGTVLALDLSNEDDATYTVEIIQGQGDASSDQIELKPDEVLEGLCETDCTLRLDNGVEEGFTGDETVIIKDGEFQISE